MTFRVLTICTGNICRSAMAHQVLQEAAAQAGLDVTVDSAGISDEEHGHPIDPRAATVLRDFGHQVPTSHRARQVSPDELDSWDLILTMTHGHQSTMQRLAQRAGVTICLDPPLGAAGVTDLRMFRSFDPEIDADAAHPGTAPSPQPDVTDPWYGGMEDFVETLHIIERCTPQIIAEIRSRLADGD